MSTLLQFTISPESLRPAFELAARVSPNTTTLEILTHALLTARNDTVIITASNLEMTVIASTPAQVTTPGSVAVPAKLFYAWLKETNDGEIAATVSDNFRMKLVHGADKTTIACMSSDDYPKVVQNVSGQAIIMPVTQFTRMVERVAFSVCEDASRPSLNGVQLIAKDNSLTMVTTDGYRLSEAKEPIESDVAATTLLPSKFILEVARVSKGAGSIKMTLGSPSMFEVMGHPQLETVKLTCPTIAAAFPAWETIMPATGNRTTSKVSTSEFLAKLKLANLIARNANNRIELTFADDHMDIHALDAGVGDCDYTISASTSGEQTTVAFNANYIRQVMEVINSEEVELRLVDTVGRTLFVIPGESAYRHLLMPMMRER